MAEVPEINPKGRSAAYASAAWAGRLAGGFLTFCLVLCIVVAMGAYLRLKQGPISLQSFLPQIQEIASENMPGLSLSIGAASVALSDTQGGAALVMEDVLLLNEDDVVFVSAPKAEGVFNIAGLARGEVVPSDVVLTGVTARIIRDVDGAFSFGFGGAETDEDAINAGGDIFAELLAASTSDEGPSKRHRLLLNDASLLYLDRQSNRIWRASDVDLSFWNTDLGMHAQTSATVSGGQFGDMTLVIAGHRVDGGDVFMSAKVERAAPGDIAAQISALDWLAAFDAPVSAEMDIGINAAGDLLSLSGEMLAGEGVIQIAQDVVEPLSAATLKFEFDPGSSRFLVSEVDILSDRASAYGQGFVEVTRTPDGEVRDVIAQLDLTDLNVAAPEALDAPLSYQRGRVTGRVTIEPFGIEIGELRLEKDALAINAAGQITLEGDALAADLTMDGGGLTVQDLLAHWPRQAAPGAREWMLANMETADVTDFDAIVRLGGEAEEVKFDFSFINAKGHYLRPMPPITGGAGAGQVDLKRFALAVDDGVVTPEGGGPLNVAGSTFVIADLGHPASPADIDLIVNGTLEDALAIVDHPPLGFISKLGVPLDGLTGDVRVKTYVYLPLLEALLLEDVEADASAIVTNLRAPVELLDTVATSKSVVLEASTKGFSLNGKVTLNGVLADVTWAEVFATGARDVTIAASISPEQLVNFGVPAPWLEEGVAGATASVSFADIGPRIAFAADLTKAGLKIEEIAWRKPAGDDASLEGVLVIDGEGLRSPNYELLSSDLRVNGNFALTPDGDLKRFRFKRLQYRGAADVELRGVVEDGGLSINVKGALLDLTRFDDLIAGDHDAPKTDEARTETPLRVRFDLDRLVLRENLSVTQANGALNLSLGGDITGRASGLVGGVAPMDIRLRNGKSRGEAVIESPNAGELLREVGFFEDGAGGDLRVVANIDGASDLRFSGDLKVEDIVIHEDAKLQTLLRGADLAALQDKMRTDGIVFNRITAPFRFEEGKLAVDEAVAKGPSIGVNITGEYDVEQDTLDLNGVFTPLYGLNSLVGKIPLLGTVLTGGDGQGLFAFTFAVKGPSADPGISVNPLSVLTPGILRRVFTLNGEGQSSSLEGVETLQEGDR